MKNHFKDYQLSKESILFCNQMSYSIPSQIQTNVIDNILRIQEDKNIIIKSEAGTGKTLAYLLLLLSNIDLNKDKLQCIIVLPTRELALQTKDYFDTFNLNVEGMKITYKLLIGGKANIPGKPIKEKLTEANEPQVIIGTLGKIYSVLLKKSKLYPMKCFVNLNNLIIDEADKYQSQNNDKTFEQLISNITNRMQQNKNNNLIQFNHIILCSASFTSSNICFYSAILKTKYTHYYYISQTENKLLLKLCSSTDNESNNNTIASIENTNTITDQIYEYYIVINQDKHVTYYEQKYQKIFYLLSELSAHYTQCIIFYNMKGKGEELAMDLRSYGFSTSFIHGDLSQDQRQLIYEKIKNKKVKIVITTDLLSRGIDLASVNLVINYDIPFNAIDYFHRVGRTGRYFTWGLAISFIQNNELEMISNIMKDQARHIHEITQLDKHMIIKLKDHYVTYEGNGNTSNSIVNETSKGIINVSLLNTKRRREQYEKESLLSEWVDTTQDLYDKQQFKFYPLENNGIELNNNENNKCTKSSFCLYCNVLKVFDI